MLDTSQVEVFVVPYLSWIVLALVLVAQAVVAASARSARQRRDEFLATTEQRARSLQIQVEQLQGERLILCERAAELKAAREAERQSFAEQLATHHEQRKELEQRLAQQQRELKQTVETTLASSVSQTIKLAANEVLTTQQQAMSTSNLEQLSHLLAPLGLSIEEFKKRVELSHNDSRQQSAALQRELALTRELSQHMSKGTEELTRALRGNNKTQGNWGEQILRRLLESSGLEEGRDYDTQVSHHREDGTRGQPDVLVHLPQQRQIVIDSKVSLTAYYDYVNSTDEAGRARSLKRHAESIRTHIKGLAAKQYDQLNGVRSLDFTVLFIPVETALIDAVHADASLMEEAWEHNIMVVSGTTILYVLKTIAALWRQEQQSQNALAIARRGAELYDKLVGFVEELDKVGASLGQANKAYDKARARLCEGRGNVIRQAEQLKELGVKASKHLPEELVERADGHGMLA